MFRPLSLLLCLAAALSACADSVPTDGNDLTDTGTPDTDNENDTAEPDTDDSDAGDDDTAEPDVVDPDGGEDDVTEPDVSAPACGDGAVNGTEVCDDSAPLTGCSPGDQCNAACSACESTEAACGDGSVNGTEVCDSSAADDGCGPGTTCNSGCSVCEAGGEPACGDGAVNGEEICDLSAADDGCADGFVCAATCNECREDVPPACGDGTVNGTEVCDGSDVLAPGCETSDTCNEDCSACVPIGTATFCGDGAVNGGEACDETAVINSGCPAGQRCDEACEACVVPPVCGDGSINGTEVCDATAAIIGCDAGQVCAADCGSCTAPPVACGNAIVDGTEVCDASASPTGCPAGQACAADCGLCRPVGCGDGTVGGGEVCDPSAPVNGCATEGATCAADCSTCQLCGDGAITGTESCDFDGLVGELGTCDYETQTCASCNCIERPINIVSAVAFGTPIPEVLGIEAVIEDNSEFAAFALVFTDDTGTILDFFQNGRDILLDLRRTPEDDPINYTLSLEFHLFNGIPEGATTAYFLVYDVNGVPSNLLSGPIDIFSPLAPAAACDPAWAVPQCTLFHDCPVDTSVCTPVTGLDDNFVLVDFGAARNLVADSMTFSFTLQDETGDFLPYWLLVLYDLDGEILGAAFRAFDAEPFNVGTDLWAVETTLVGASENLGIDISTIGGAAALVYDRTDYEVSTIFTF